MKLISKHFPKVGAWQFWAACER